MIAGKSLVIVIVLFSVTSIAHAATINVSTEQPTVQLRINAAFVANDLSEMYAKDVVVVGSYAFGDDLDLGSRAIEGPGNATHSIAKSPKSLSTARLISVSGTFVPIVGGSLAALGANSKGSDVALICAISFTGLGLIYGPSTGHAYAGSTSRFFKWSSFRALAIGGIIGGLAMFATGVFSENDKENLGLPGLLLGASSTGFLVVTIVKDFRTLDDSVNDYNRKHGFTSIDLRPEYFPHHEALGLALSFQF